MTITISRGRASPRLEIWQFIHARAYGAGVVTSVVELTAELEHAATLARRVGRY